jgi:hypothetical protein
LRLLIFVMAHPLCSIRRRERLRHAKWSRFFTSNV